MFLISTGLRAVATGQYVAPANVLVGENVFALANGAKAERGFQSPYFDRRVCDCGIHSIIAS